MGKRGLSRMTIKIVCSPGVPAGQRSPAGTPGLQAVLPGITST
ncbi:MAG TPA: hypothetical protein VH540_22955 [Ktedonobacterales bacterium]